MYARMTKTSCSAMARRVSSSGMVRATISNCQRVECSGLVNTANLELPRHRRG